MASSEISKDFSKELIHEEYAMLGDRWHGWRIPPETLGQKMSMSIVAWEGLNSLICRETAREYALNTFLIWMAFKEE